MAEDPVKDGLNWYAYCAGNPVMFCDIFGLKKKSTANVEDWITNANEFNRNEPKYDYIRSAIRAYNGGFITKEFLLRNIVGNGGVIREDMKLSAVSIEEAKGKVTINAMVNFSGDMVNRKFEGEDITYEEAAKNGIERAWSGEVNGISISTSVTVATEADKQIYQTVNLELKNKCARSKYHLGTNTATVYKGDERGHIYSSKLFGIVAAHEFAHVAFNIGDAYIDKKSIKENKYSPYGEFDSLMRDMYEVNGATALDFEMLLASFGTEGLFEYIDRPDILGKYKK